MKETEEEVWKPIIGLKGYTASNRGNVTSYKREGNPKKLKAKGLACAYHLFCDTGEHFIAKKKILYAYLHEINPLEIEGYIIGPLDQLQNVSREEFYMYACKKMTDSKKFFEEKTQQFYDESLHDILLLRQFHQTGDITDVAGAIATHKNLIIDYIIKKGIGNANSAYDIWSCIQERCLLGICEKKLAVLNIRTYLTRMVRSEIISRKKEASRIVNYDDYNFYRGI